MLQKEGKFEQRIRTKTGSINFQSAQINLQKTSMKPTSLKFKFTSNSKHHHEVQKCKDPKQNITERRMQWVLALNPKQT